MEIDRPRKIKIRSNKLNANIYKNLSTERDTAADIQ
jgi:hypothetical protein